MDHFPQINQFLKDSLFFYTIVIGMDGRYTYISKNYNRNFGFTGGTLLGAAFSVTLHTEDIPICERIGTACFGAPGELFAATLRKHDGAGGYVTTQWEMQALFNEQGQPDGIFCIGYNITEVVTTRTKLTEIAFIQSHQVRKPLANIIGLAAMIQQASDGHVQELCVMLEKSTTELDEVIKEISAKTDQ